MQRDVPVTNSFRFVVAVLFSLGGGAGILWSLLAVGQLGSVMLWVAGLLLFALPVGVLAAISGMLLLERNRVGVVPAAAALGFGALGSSWLGLWYLSYGITGKACSFGCSYLSQAEATAFAGWGILLVAGTVLCVIAAAMLYRIGKTANE